MTFEAGNRRRFDLAVIATIFLFFLIAFPAYAQVTGATLSGTVVDSTGGVVPGAKLSVKNTATGIVHEVMSDSSGLYLVPNLLPGRYEITVAAAGFSTERETGIVLSVGELRRFRIFHCVWAK